MPIKWWGRQNAAPLKFDPKPSEAAFSAVFSNFDKCRLEIAGDVMSDVAVDLGSMDVCAILVDSRLNSGRHILRLFARLDPLYALFAVFYCVLQPTGSS